MSQSVSVLSCEGPNCPYYIGSAQDDYSGSSQDYNEKQICSECFVENDEVCKFQDNMKKTSKKPIFKTQDMTYAKGLVSLHINLMDVYLVRESVYEENHTDLQSGALTLSSDAGVSLNYKSTKGKEVKLHISYSVVLSDNGEYWHMKTQKYECSDSKKKFRFCFDKEQSEIDVPVNSSKIMMHIYEVSDIGTKRSCWPFSLCK